MNEEEYYYLRKIISENMFTVHCLTIRFILHVHKIKATFSWNLFVIVKLWKCFQTLLPVLRFLDLLHKTSNLYLLTDLQLMIILSDCKYIDDKNGNAMKLSQVKKFC